MFKSRWKWLVGFLAAEAVVAYALCAILMCTSFSELLRVPSQLVHPQYAVPVSASIVCLLALQLAFLTPVAFPILKADARPGWARLLLSGFAITLMIVVPPVYAVAVACQFFDLEFQTFPLELLFEDYPQITLLLAMFIVGPLVTLVLRRKWSAGIPVRQSVHIAGLVSGILVAGAVMIPVSALETLKAHKLAADVIAVFDSDPLRVALFSLPLVGWGLATPLLMRFAKRHPGDSALDKLAARLLLGTIFEVAAIIPFDVMARRRNNCYCFEPSFFALIAAASAGFIVFGPAVFLIVGRRRAKAFSTVCPACEYDMSGFPHALCCPECGAGWKSPPKDPTA